MINQHSCQNHFLAFDESIQRNAKKASLVLWITALTMLVEIYFGYTSGSMALLADGWHMATHAAALGITYLTYRLATHPEMAKNFNFGGGKIIALGGFASSVFLLCVILLIGFESIQRFFKPQQIHFDEALLVATIGLIVNVICAFILRDGHSHGAHSHDSHSHRDAHAHDHAHDHEHAHNHNHNHNHNHDHNIRGAYLHILADALTSVGAIVALLAGKFYGLYYLDPLIGLIGTVIILKWAIRLLKDTGWELLDGHPSSVDFVKLKVRIESTGTRIEDLHIWKMAPRMLACELIVVSQQLHGTEHYRRILHNEFGIRHSVIEERQTLK